MALFKIEKGLKANLANNRPNTTEGFCYFTTDDGKFYIDTATAIGTSNRVLLNAGAADKLTVNAGAANKPIYFKNGVPTEGSYELNKTVPSNAKFTDTNTKVTQTVTTSDADYPLLLAPSGQTARTTTISYFDSGVTLNPSTNTIAANISGNAATATKIQLTDMSDGGLYHLPFFIVNANDSNYSMQYNNAFRLWESVGNEGAAQLKLGNHLTNTNSEKRVGEIHLYGKSSGITILTPTTTATTNNVLNLPASAGTLALDNVFGASGSTASKGLVPAPSTTAGTTKYLREDGTWVKPPNTNTTYSAGTGISLSGTTFSNSGVRSVATGGTNGTISVNTNGTAANVAVKGLAAAAYRGVKELTAKGDLGWGTNNNYIADISMLAYWNGAYKDTASNLSYCNQGAFGSIVTKGTGDYVPIRPNQIEFGTSSSAGHGGYLDFHYNGSSADHTSRIIESAPGTLSLNNVQIKGSTITGSLSGNASTASKLAPHSGVTTNDSSWDGAAETASSTVVAWRQAFKNSKLGSDSGDLVLKLRAGQYSSGGTELCMMIDGDYYAMGNKVLHAGNYSSYAAPASHSHSYLPLTGGTLSGALTTLGQDIVLGCASSSSNDSGDITYTYGNGTEKCRIWTANEYTSYCGPNWRVYRADGTSLGSGHLWASGESVTGAVWNDYAECRESDCNEPGYVLSENGDDTLFKSNERLAPFAGVSSDTWGFSQGETEKAKTHIAVAGRVLVYPYRNRNEYKPGDCVCAAPGGTVDIMTREEVINWPDRIVGTVSCVPEYEEWGGGEGADRAPVKVNGRIWIKVK